VRAGQVLIRLESRDLQANSSHKPKPGLNWQPTGRAQDGIITTFDFEERSE